MILEALGVAAVFGLFLIIALVAAAILGLGTVMPYWASALVFALIFLIVLWAWVIPTMDGAVATAQQAYETTAGVVHA